MKWIRFSFDLPWNNRIKGKFLTKSPDNFSLLEYLCGHALAQQTFHSHASAFLIWQGKIREHKNQCGAMHRASTVKICQFYVSRAPNCVVVMWKWKAAKTRPFLVCWRITTFVETHHLFASTTVIDNNVVCFSCKLWSGYWKSSILSMWHIILKISPFNIVSTRPRIFEKVNLRKTQRNS